ncbi:MAG: hypothetical protein WCF19_04270 [Chlamydiales bacterium]
MGRQAHWQGKRIESVCTALLIGIWAYGKRLLVHGAMTRRSAAAEVEFHKSRHIPSRIQETKILSPFSRVCVRNAGYNCGHLKSVNLGRVKAANKSTILTCLA